MTVLKVKRSRLVDHSYVTQKLDHTTTGHKLKYSKTGLVQFSDGYCIEDLFKGLGASFTMTLQ